VKKHEIAVSYPQQEQLRNKNNNNELSAEYSPVRADRDPESVILERGRQCQAI